MEKYREGIRRLALSAGLAGLLVRVMDLLGYFVMDGGRPESFFQWVIMLAVTFFYFFVPYIFIKYGFEWAIWIKEGFDEQEIKK